VKCRYFCLPFSGAGWFTSGSPILLSMHRLLRTLRLSEKPGLLENGRAVA
jgi:hypothetical protein